MAYSITNTYKMKREIINFSRKLSEGLSAADKRFHADMTYGILASRSCLLTKITQSLQEESKKIHTVDRLSDHLKTGVHPTAQAAYLNYVQKIAASDPVILIDDSDVVKPEGYHFEALDMVRDGSKSTKNKTAFSKGYHVTEACVLTHSNHPVSIFSKVYSTKKDGFLSANDITFQAMDVGAKLFKKATYVMDRGYDNNKMFQKVWEIGQDFVIRLTQKRKFFFHNKWIPATQLCAERKGKIKMKCYYRGENHDAYISHVKVRLSAEKRKAYLVLVYGITEKPMMLVTNKTIRCKEDVINIARLYFSRWRIEEYFRSKKQIFDFENFRVRSLSSINALNFYITIAMTFLARITMKKHTNELQLSILEASRPIKSQVQFFYYRISDGIFELLKCATIGIGDWFKPKRTDQNQLRFRLPA